MESRPRHRKKAETALTFGFFFFLRTPESWACGVAVTYLA